DDHGPIEPATSLPFPPVTKAHIMNCAYHHWWPKYRTITPKSRMLPLSPPFLDYLRADGIILPDDDQPPQADWDSDSGVFSASDNPDAEDTDDDEEATDVVEGWQNIHGAIKRTIDELGGRVVPKLNWSAPKDATWMNANTMDCRSPNDVYLLLKSSDFITHDLEHAFDDAEDTPDVSIQQSEIPYYLVLRKTVPNFNPSVEFRCFVRNNKILGICQRDLNHFDFLSKMEGRLQSLIQEFFDVRLRDTFEDDNFVFDVYVPSPYTRVWLVDINPWAPRTDAILFSWLELLTMPEPPEREVEKQEDLSASAAEEFVRLRIGRPSEVEHMNAEAPVEESKDEDADAADESEDSDVEDIWLPELRLVKKTDPEAYSFATPQYSAQKMPKDVVEAGASGEGLREFAKEWQDILARRQEEDRRVE
ncbi:D123-domain-containing protein, partial [Teratosphaeria nubilosa]